MNDDLRLDDPPQELLNDVLAAYLEAVARGETVDRHTLLAKHLATERGTGPFF